MPRHYQYFLPVDGPTLHLYQTRIWFKAKHVQIISHKKRSAVPPVDARVNILQVTSKVQTSCNLESVEYVPGDPMK